MSKILPIMLIFQLLEVYPHYHMWLNTTWEVKIKRGPFIGTFWSKKLNWSVDGRDFNAEEYDSVTNTVKLGAARLGLRD